MKVIIIGCGKVGYTLAQQLNEEGHEVTLVDRSAERLQPALNNLDVQAIVGNGSSFEVQKEAGVKDADLLIAVTDQDEINLISCLIAKKSGNCRTIARVRNPEYSADMDYLKLCIGMSLVINPEYAAGAEIAQLVDIPEAAEVDSFARGRVELIQTVIPEDSILNGMTVQEFSKMLNHKVLVCIQLHDGEVSIPKGRSVLHSGDTISVILPKKFIPRFYRECKLGNMKDYDDVMIVGGGRTTFYLAQRLIKAGYTVKIVEEDDERCHLLSESLPEATIIHADATDHDALLDEGLDKVDVFVSLLAEDERNAFLSLYVNKINPKCRRIVRLERLRGSVIVDGLSLGSIVSPRDITTEYILQFVRSRTASKGDNVEALYRLMDNRV
ncbi:MAG: Trk system potassium transporter TrkA, partial [Lachnospiraceae bacterium]|nr:Trk system potassium transporter TrkA [Lachnospiraceae bacterium]